MFDESWHKKLESAQYNAALAITRAIRGTNTVKLSEIGITALAKQSKLRRLNLFYKIYEDQSPLYLYNLIPAKTPGNYYPLRKVKEIVILKVKHRFFENSFSPATITE